MASEEALIRRAQRGDHEAFGVLLRRYERKVFSLALRLMGNDSDADDAAQEALVKVYVRLPLFRGESAFSTWLFRVVTNACLDELRRRKRSLRLHTEQPHLRAQAVPVQAESEAPGPDLLAERNELRRSMHRAIARLAETHQVILWLRDLQGLSYQEVADTLGCSVDAVRSRLHRARTALRRVLQEDRQIA